MSKLLSVIATTLLLGRTSAFSLSMQQQGGASRRAFFQKTVSTAAAGVVATSVPTILPANAAPEIYNTPSGLKYAILKQPKDPKKATVPQDGDLVAIEYTGYLTSGQIFDSTHAEGKANALSFKLGDKGAVIDGLQEIVRQMGVGEKVQVIVPPNLAFGEKGLCLDDGECLIKPGSTLVYDVYLKKSAIPPP